MKLITGEGAEDAGSSGNSNKRQQASHGEMKGELDSWLPCPVCDSRQEDE